MSLNGKRDYFIKSDLETVGDEMGVSAYSSIIEEVNDVVSNWEKYAIIAGIDEERISSIQSQHCIV
jgi:hypothetical protein